jgi:hypothetical protein
VTLPTPDTRRPPAGETSAPLGGFQRWLYQGRRHQRRLLLPQYRTAAALLGTAVAALLLVLVVALWPSSKRNNVVLPEIPRSTPTSVPTLPSPDNPDGSATPSADAPTGTPVPGQPPLPTADATTNPPRPQPAQPAPRPPSHNISPTSFEAESATSTLIGQARIRTNRDASGGFAIGFLGSGNGSSGALRMNGLGVPVAGTYTVTIFYISGDGNRRARVSLNDGAPITVTFPSTGDWNTVGSLALRGTFDAGGNSLAFDNPVDWAPDIDRVVVSN